ncbi:O-unit flippase [Calothrix sp. HK-06]|nr:O-unit flippase [Calothrix sp. HK-06]
MLNNKLKCLELLAIKLNFKSRPVASTAWLLFDRLFRMVVGLVVGVWIARYLGAKQYGILSYASSFVALFSPFASLGLDSIMIRHIVRGTLIKEEILGTAFCLKIIGAIIFIVLTISCNNIVNPNRKIGYLITIIATASVFQAFDVIEIWFQSQYESKFSAISKNFAILIVALFQIILITNVASLEAFAWSRLIEYCLLSLCLITAYVMNKYSLFSWRWNYLIAKDLLKQSFPLIFSGLAIMIYVKIDQVMLGKMISESAVGVYSAATRISEVSYFIPVTIASSLSPSIYAAKDKSEELYYRRIGQMLRILIFISIVIAILISLLSKNIILLIFGNDYIESAKILEIHTWALAFVSMGTATSSWFIAEGLTHFSMLRTFAGAVSNIILNLYLIPKYAGVGAALATVISYAFAGFIFHLAHKKMHRLFMIQLKSMTLARL